MVRSGSVCQVSICFAASQSAAALGESIAVNGVCLTVADKIKQGFKVNLLTETLKATTLGSLKPGMLVHLEKAMRYGDKMGGHFVSGHVDGCVELVKVDSRPKETLWWLRSPKPLLRWIVPKGSVALEGVSLTVQEVRKPLFKVALIPHTLKKTIFASKKVGERLNLEVDMLARYGTNITSEESLARRRSRIRSLVQQGF